MIEARTHGLDLAPNLPRGQLSHPQESWRAVVEEARVGLDDAAPLSLARDCGIFGIDAAFGRPIP